MCTDIYVECNAVLSINKCWVYQYVLTGMNLQILLVGIFETQACYEKTRMMSLSTFL